MFSISEGNQRTSGEVSRKEGGKIFGSGSRTPISITLLVKNSKNKQNRAEIQYHDIGDYLTRDEKLKLISKLNSANSPEMKWKKIIPNDQGDWLNQRNELFETFFPIQPDKKYNLNSKSYFVINSRGYETSRDAWIYNFSQSKLTSVIEKSVLFFNEQVAKYITAKQKSKSLKANDFIDSDPKNISWSSSLISLLEKGEIAKFDKEEIATGMYRPFSKQILYQGEKFINRRGQNEDFFQT